MNIHGYKQSMKRMARSLKQEENKPSKHQNQAKIRRLSAAKADCGRRIRELKRVRDSKNLKRQFRKKKK